MCNFQKHINNFYEKYSECKDCNLARRLERYCGEKDKISNQQIDLIRKKRKKSIIAKAKQFTCIQFRDLVRTYVQLENRLKAMEENSKKLPLKDSENN